MRRVTGIGGVFFKSADPAATRAWYRRHLGLETTDFGWPWRWEGGGYTIWSAFEASTDYFGPGQQEFMVNYRVADLVALLALLKSEGVEVLGDWQQHPNGKFAWILDCDGRKIELWEPVPLEEDPYLAGSP